LRTNYLDSVGYWIDPLADRGVNGRMAGIYDRFIRILCFGMVDTDNSHCWGAVVDSNDASSQDDWQSAWELGENHAGTAIIPTKRGV
jgi:hypothetical protein